MSLSTYQSGFQLNPIVLVGGVAGAGMLPIVSVLSARAFSGALSQSQPLAGQDFFGQFRVLPGHSLMDNEVATYPVANQTVAANAVITNPLRLSLEMLVPADGNSVTLASKKTLITALKSTLDKHTSLGGYYNVATPSYIYQGCLLTSLVDASDESEGSQPQVRWVWNFMQPLLTVAAAQAAQNQAMAKISSQTQNAGNPPGSQPIATGVGQPAANIAPTIVPAASNNQAASVAPTTTLGQNFSGNTGVQSYASSLTSGKF